MLRKFLRNILNCVSLGLRFTTIVITILYIVPVIMAGYIYGLTLASFIFGRGLSTDLMANALIGAVVSK